MHNMMQVGFRNKQVNKIERELKND